MDTPSQVTPNARRLGKPIKGVNNENPIEINLYGAISYKSGMGKF